jgi:starvation-inducible DNA-binding protein
MNNSTEYCADAMNHLLANEFALFTKTLNYHWNITGPRFHSIHAFLEEGYNDLLVTMDDIAERVRIIGEIPLGTVSKMNETMSLSEKNGKSLSSNEMLSDLLAGHQEIQGHIRETLENKQFDVDPGTEDFLISVLQKHEKTSWMLKSHLD